MKKGWMREMTKCNCETAARDGSFPLLLDHVPTCPEFPGCIRELIVGLVRGMEEWAADEDGIHPEAWAAYQRAKVAIGEPVEGIPT